jgi:dihydrolipoamide dehydrogenase
VGSAQFLDPHTLALGSFAPGNGSLIIKSSGANGEMRLQADKFILAAGGHARRLPFPGSELALTHSDVWTMRRLPRSVAIVGAAATGCQLASVLNEFGSQVTLLDIAPRIVPVEDELVSRTLQERFEARGIRVITGMQSITRLDRNGRGLQFAFQQAGQEQVLNVEAVIVAVGWVGNLEPLNLDAAGVQAQRGFVLVNDALQTSASHIFAAGDITGRMMLVQSATVEGIVAAENAVAGAQQTFAHNIVPHGGFTDPEYGSVGLTEAQAHTRGDSVVATVSYSEIDRAVIDDQTIGFCKLIVGRERHFIWGAHVVGEQALEVTQMVAAAMAANAQIGDLARLEIAYPTYAAIVGLAARRVVQALGVQATDASWQTLGNAAGAEWERGAG